MYAAAGGASLASRQARQRQRQNKKAAAQKASKASDLLKQPPQKEQFHNYTDELVPRLSRVERNALKPPALPNERRHSTSNYHLKEPRAKIKESPSICLPVHPSHGHCHGLAAHAHHLHHVHGPGGHAAAMAAAAAAAAPSPRSPSITSHQLPQILIPEGDKSLERRCSFVRQVEEEQDGEKGLLDRCNHICNFEIKEKTWDHHEPGFYTEYDLYGSLDYPFSECSQGRAAWQERERGRRCSLSDEARQHRLKQNEAHHRWMKRNRIHDATYGGSSEEEDFFDVYHQSAAANALLYVGLGTIAIGAVIFFVGTGEKGFKTLELRLIGPTLVACGLLCCLVRVLLCACPSTCLHGRKKTRLKNVCPHTHAGSSSAHHHGSSSRCPLTRERSTDRRTTHASSSFEKHKKKVSIVTSSNNHPVASTSTTNFQDAEQSAALIQVQADGHRQMIPIITVPEDDDELERGYGMPRDDSLIELEHLDAVGYDLQSVSSYESETVIEIECKPKEPEVAAAAGLSKHARTRAPALAADELPSTSTCTSTSKHDQFIVIEPPPAASTSTSTDESVRRRDAEAHHSGIVLSPLQLGQ